MANHIGSNKHRSGKEKLALKETRERDIAKCLKVHDGQSSNSHSYSTS